jgi:hypothetical protein
MGIGGREPRGSRPPTPPDVRVTSPAVRRSQWMVSPHTGPAGRAPRSSVGAARSPARGSDSDATGHGLTWRCSRPAAGSRRVFATPDIPVSPMAPRGRSAAAAGSTCPGRTMGSGLRRSRSPPAQPPLAPCLPDLPHGPPSCAACELTYLGCDCLQGFLAHLPPVRWAPGARAAEARAVPQSVNRALGLIAREPQLALQKAPHPRHYPSPRLSTPHVDVRLVGIADKPVPSLLQLFIELVQPPIRQKR